VDKDSYLLELCRYIVLNPVRAGMAQHPKDYPWSSYCATAGLEKKLGFLSTDWILAQFGNDRKQVQQEYRRFVLAGLSAESPWKKLTGQCLLGKEPFLEKLLPFLQKKTGCTEIPRIQRFALRPPTRAAFSKRAVKAAPEQGHCYSTHGPRILPAVYCRASRASLCYR